MNANFPLTNSTLNINKYINMKYIKSIFTSRKSRAALMAVAATFTLSLTTVGAIQIVEHYSYGKCTWSGCSCKKFSADSGGVRCVCNHMYFNHESN